MTAFKKRLDILTENLPEFLEKTREIPVEIFCGPSVHFHQRAIEAAKGDNFLKPLHLQMIYAVLPAWGMQRMGKGETKTNVCCFESFVELIMDKGKDLEAFRQKNIENVKDEDIKAVVDLMFEIKINARETKSQIVSSSKTLHHILPDIVPPIDRAHSIKFMGSGHKIAKGLEKQVATEFIMAMQVFIKNHKSEMADFLDERLEGDAFNTSLPKLFDNLIIAFYKFPK